jgi:hypothetical protein
MGAQVTEYAWITNLALVLLGISSILSGWKFYKGLTFHRFLILLFGISVILSAAFNSAPVDSLKPYDITEDGWHSYFLLTSWLTFLILTLSTAFILENRRDRVLTIVTGAIIIFLSLLNSEIFSVAGIWQRLIYLISTGWMIYCFRSTNR